jgi:hypothetical protein
LPDCAESCKPAKRMRAKLAKVLGIVIQYKIGNNARPANGSRNRKKEAFVKFYRRFRRPVSPRLSRSVLPVCLF